jgi:hypothetical protein
MPAADYEWSKPAAMAIPAEGYFELERGRYGPVDPRTPACYGFSIIAKVKPGREAAIREYGKVIQAAIESTPDLLAPLRLHYLRWVLFDVGGGLHFQYQGIFDTDFDKYTEDAVKLCTVGGHHGVHQPGGLSGGLADKPRGIHQIRSGAPMSQLPRVR